MAQRPRPRRGTDRERHERVPLMIQTIPRSALPENGVVTFEVAGARYLIADVDGDVQAFSVLGRSEGSVDRAAIADGRVLCPLHGWPIDPIEGVCGAAQLCRYEPLSVEVAGDQIRVSIPGS
jgi:nitrite reductase/ring-hydroxylating ferredoxin subunit